MDENHISRMLAETVSFAKQVAQLEGVKKDPQKHPIMTMILQHLHESLLVFSHKVEVSEPAACVKQIGNNLSYMLNELRERSLWLALQRGLSDLDITCIVKLTGQMHALADELLCQE